MQVWPAASLAPLEQCSTPIRSPAPNSTSMLPSPSLYRAAVRSSNTPASWGMRSIMSHTPHLSGQSLAPISTATSILSSTSTVKCDINHDNQVKSRSWLICKYLPLSFTYLLLFNICEDSWEINAKHRAYGTQNDIASDLIWFDKIRFDLIWFDMNW